MKHFAIFGMEIHVGDNRKPLKKYKTEFSFVAAAPSCYKNRATYDNTDLSNIDLGNSYDFQIVAKFCYLGCMLFTRDG